MRTTPSTCPTMRPPTSLVPIDWHWIEPCAAHSIRFSCGKRRRLTEARTVVSAWSEHSFDVAKREHRLRHDHALVESDLAIHNEWPSASVDRDAKLGRRRRRPISPDRRIDRTMHRTHMTEQARCTARTRGWPRVACDRDGARRPPVNRAGAFQQAPRLTAVAPRHHGRPDRSQPPRPRRHVDRVERGRAASR